MNRTGYWPSAWPVECGGNHRPKTAAPPGLDLQPTDHLVATTRHTGRWPVMFIQRDPGQLYLHGTTGPEDDRVVGWVERVDPITLEPLVTSGDLPAGRHEWCGSIAAHANGDLYMVSGSYVHRLGADCAVKAAVELPVDQAHNGLLILDDGSIATKDLRIGDQPSTLTVLDEDLTVLAREQLPEASMGRLAIGRDVFGSGTRTDGPNLLYATGSSRLFRYRWDGLGLTLDQSWQPEYRSADGGLAWEATISDGRVWLMDNGNIPEVEARFAQSPTVRPERGGPTGMARTPPRWSGPVRALGISTEDHRDQLVLRPTEQPSGWVIAPPLAHANIVVTWDTGNTGIAAFDVADGRGGDMLWFQPFRCSMQPLLFPDTQELVVNDFRILSDRETSDDLVVLDLTTGRMKARVPTGATRMNGMFLCPGWDRDIYYCSSGTVARVQAMSL